MGRLDSALREGLESIRGWSGSGEQETSCLMDISTFEFEGIANPTLQHIQADATEPVDVGVIDLRQEADFGWGHGIVVWEEEFELEDTTLMTVLAKERCS